MDAPREDLIRSTPMLVAQTAFTGEILRMDGATEDGRIMTGYPIVFNQYTEIDSMFEGHFMERIDPGAMDLTIEQRGGKIPALFNHGFDPQIGDKPMGIPSLLEARDFGMWAEVPLSRTSYNEDLIELMNDGALYGQSFRFTVLDERWVDKPIRSEINPDGIPERTIMEIKLREFGPVTFPAYEATTLGVRSADAFRSWQQKPLVEFSASVSPGDATDSPPEQVPVERKLVTATRPRRNTATADLATFIERYRQS